MARSGAPTPTPTRGSGGGGGASTCGDHRRPQATTAFLWFAGGGADHRRPQATTGDHRRPQPICGLLAGRLFVYFLYRPPFCHLSQFFLLFLSILGHSGHFWLISFQIGSKMHPSGCSGLFKHLKCLIFWGRVFFIGISPSLFHSEMFP